MSMPPCRLGRLIALAVLLCLPGAWLHADRYTFLGDYVSHDRSATAVTIRTTTAPLRLTVCDAATVRVQVGRPDGGFLDIPSVTVPSSATTAAWSLIEREDAVELLLPAGRVVITKRPVRLQMLDAGGDELLADDPSFGHGWDGKEVQAWKRLRDGERFYGLGEKTGDVDKRGAAWTMWNSDIPGYGNDRDPLYATVPFVIGALPGRAWGLFFDNTYRSSFVLGAGSDRVWSFGAEDGEMSYYVFFGPRLRDVIRQYTALTGRMPLPPLWALGYQQCRWSYYPEYELRDLARNFRQRRIPADVLYLDIRYMDAYKVFTWDAAAFPDPARLLSDLRADGFHVVPIIDPGVKIEEGYRVYDEGMRDGHFIRYPDGSPYAGQVWPGWCRFPDFTRPATRRWWGGFIGDLLRGGIGGLWNDMNEPAVWGKEMPSLVEFDDDGRRSTIKKIHNIYGYLMAQATYEGARSALPAKRPFIVSRAGYAGQQKYSALWTGDNTARFDDLAMGIRMCLGLGLSGMPFTGPDVGGFIDSPTPELFARWMQAGVFTPFFRTHTHINTRNQEPWSFGEDVEDNVRASISLRYRLLPYLYTAFRDASRDGLPIMRPLFLDNDEDPAAYDGAWQHQYRFGRDILVAPVFRAGQTFQKVYFPAGLWVDPHDGAAWPGGRTGVIETPWWRPVYFYRAGACIPTREVQQHSGERPLTRLVVDAVTGAADTSRLYLDAGDGYGYADGDFDELTFVMTEEGGIATLDLRSTDGSWARAIDTVVIRMFNVPRPPRRVQINGTAAAETTDAGDPVPGRFSYDATRRVCTLALRLRDARAHLVRLTR